MDSQLLLLTDQKQLKRNSVLELARRRDLAMVEAEIGPFHIPQGSDGSEEMSSSDAVATSV